MDKTIRYSVDFRNPSDDHIRTTVGLLSSRGYRSRLKGTSDGESWDVYTDRTVDEETKKELDKIGVKLKLW